jgi:NTP pyrophosphatase (non-canonical NTP hydrolase)
MKTLNELRDEIHENAKNKGFWDSSRETGTLLMLCVSELAEALEADRKGQYAKIDDAEFIIDGRTIREDLDLAIKENDMIKFEDIFRTQVKDTFEDELADNIIRILDLCGARGIDIDKHIELKMKYNETRERMHGKKY